ncbi:MAG: hypothetical protein LBQ65_08960 [Tannerellaceae bacterium]|jgi:hypothetical protein|nr:hypothetical protein [Tannerellaceae bacterium]
MMKTIKKITGLLFCLCILSNLSAQVTIGTTEAPAEGALLQLKDIVNAAEGGENAKKGLLMPRVALVDYTKLDPMFPGASDDQKKEHAGLIVYNLTEDDKLKEGIMVWNGEIWNHIKNKEIKKDMDSEIKKKLYTNLGAIEGNSVSLNSIEAMLKKIGDNNSFAYPHFKTDPTTQLRIFHYQIIQHWNEDGGSGYSYDVGSMYFNQQYPGYKQFADQSQMSPKERNEVWMFEQGSEEIYHIRFITLGEEKDDASNIFAILVERF